MRLGEWMRAPPTAADRWTCAGLTAASLVLAVATVGAVRSSVTAAAPAGPELDVVLALQVVFHALALPLVVTWLALLLAASNAGWSVRRMLGLGLAAMLASLAATLYGLPWTMRLLGALANAPMGGPYQHPADPSTWFGHELLAALAGTAPDGFLPPEGARELATWMLGRAITPAVVIAILLVFAIPPRPRWPWPLVLVLGAGSVGLEALAERFVAQPGFERGGRLGGLVAEAAVALVLAGVAVIGRSVARRAPIAAASRPRGSRLRRMAQLVAGAVLGGALAVAPFVAQGRPSHPEIPQAGMPAPALRLTSLDGRVVDLAEQRGKVVVVAFWASWCGPCRREMPVLQAIRDEMGADRLVVLPVDVKESRDEVASAMPVVGARMDVLLSSPEVLEAWGVEALPSSFLVGPDGVIAAHHLGFGPASEQELRTEIAELLGDEQ